jgi:hypothetical protein
MASRILCSTERIIYARIFILRPRRQLQFRIKIRVFNRNVSSSVRERSGQVRPYVRPVMQHGCWLLAIMGVRLRVRHLSCWRARGHEYFSGMA